MIKIIARVLQPVLWMTWTWITLQTYRVASGQVLWILISALLLMAAIVSTAASYRGEGSQRGVSRQVLPAFYVIFVFFAFWVKLRPEVAMYAIGASLGFMASLYFTWRAYRR